MHIVYCNNIYILHRYIYITHALIIYFCRYNVRGLDSDGHAANFVETEQIVEYDYTKCSFVQVNTCLTVYIPDL